MTSIASRQSRRLKSRHSLTSYSGACTYSPKRPTLASRARCQSLGFTSVVITPVTGTSAGSTERSRSTCSQGRLSATTEFRLMTVYSSMPPYAMKFPGRPFPAMNSQAHPSQTAWEPNRNRSACPAVVGVSISEIGTPVEISAPHVAQCTDTDSCGRSTTGEPAARHAINVWLSINHLR